MTSFEPTSRWAILPSGDTLDFVSPGMSKVVGRWRDAGVEAPESLRRGGLLTVRYTWVISSHIEGLKFDLHYGAVWRSV